MKWICTGTNSYLLLLVAVGAFLLIYFGVVLPAIWSRKPARRKAAASVLAQLLGFRLRFEVTPRRADVTASERRSRDHNDAITDESTDRC